MRKLFYLLRRTIAIIFSSTIISIILGTSTGITGIIMIAVLGICEINKICTDSVLDTSVGIVYSVFLVFITVIFLGGVYVLISISKSYSENEEDKRKWDKFEVRILLFFLLVVLIIFCGYKFGITIPEFGILKNA